MLIWVKGMEIYHGVHIDHVTLHNEPEVSWNNGSWLYYPPARLRDMIKRLGARFQAEGITTKIFAPETTAITGMSPGGYTDLIFGIDKEWEVAARGELWRRMQGADDNLEINRNSFGRDALRATGAVSYMPSHFSRLRLQYTYESIDGFDDGHIILLQTEVAAGAHGAHKY